MFIDQGTLLDLDILRTAAPHGLTILAMVDRTRTQAGREHLCRRLSEPADSAAGILRLQEAHQTIARALASYRHGLDRAALDVVARYLDSRWERPRGRNWVSPSVEGVWLRLRYSPFLREVAEGRLRTVALLQAADEIATRAQAEPSAIMCELGGRLRDLLESRECRDLLRLGDGRSPVRRLAFDQLARGTGKPQLARLIDALGDLEAMWSLAAATIEHGWTYPTVGTQLRVTGLRHPFLERTAVTNDLGFAADQRVCFLTGPNMAGKSTLLKAVGVATLLAHAGVGVAAVAMEFRPMRMLFSSVQIVDNLIAGESFYLAEVRRVRTLAAALLEHGPAVILLDEPFRGTNVLDAREATLAVLVRLADQPATTSIVASHLGELGPRLADDPRVRFLRFEADLHGDVPRFDYLVREGVSQQRLGMTLLHQEGVLELLDEAARR